MLYCKYSSRQDEIIDGMEWRLKGCDVEVRGDKRRVEVCSGGEESIRET